MERVVARHVRFWLATAVAIILALWLLHGILLPFVAGMALPYLLDPLADRLERLGLNRAIAALALVALFSVALLILAIYLASDVYTGAPSEAGGGRAMADAGPKRGPS